MSAAPKPILVAGAINTDLVATVVRAPAAGETVTGTGFAIHGGGKGANQAVAAARSGGDVLLTGAVGDDEFGRDRLAELARDGVGTSWVMVRERETSGVALILVECDGENRIAYVPGATALAPPLHVVSALEAVQPAFVLATNELPAESLSALFVAARRAQATVVYNATPDPERARDLVREVSILIVNQSEAAALLDADAAGTVEGTVAALLDLGPETVILTAGAKGACAGMSDAIQWHRPPSVDVVDTTGAGDTFCGAMVCELARGASLEDAVRYGVIASALSVTRPGAQSSIPTRTDIEQWNENAGSTA